MVAYLALLCQSSKMLTHPQFPLTLLNNKKNFKMSLMQWNAQKKGDKKFYVAPSLHIRKMQNLQITFVYIK